MTQSVLYSILFFDPDEKHHHTGSNIIVCDPKENLEDKLALYGQTKIVVCICCPNKDDILNTLRQHPNVASIFVCINRSHHDPQGQHWATNQPPMIRENSFDDNDHWQITAHTVALNSNDQSDVTRHIKQILERLIQQNYDVFHGTFEETRSA